MIENMAILATAVFAGAAIYISAVEHPARMSCGLDVALAQWQPSYKRGTIMQAPLAVAGALFGVSAWLAGGGWIWLVSGLLIGSVVPFTLAVMFPINRRLEEKTLDANRELAMHLLWKWGVLHGVRTALGTAALVVMIFSRA